MGAENVSTCSYIYTFAGKFSHVVISHTYMCTRTMYFAHERTKMAACKEANPVQEALIPVPNNIDFEIIGEQSCMYMTFHTISTHTTGQQRADIILN